MRLGKVQCTPCRGHRHFKMRSLSGVESFGCIAKQLKWNDDLLFRKLHSLCHHVMRTTLIYRWTKIHWKAEFSIHVDRMKGTCNVDMKRTCTSDGFFGMILYESIEINVGRFSWNKCMIFCLVQIPHANFYDYCLRMNLHFTRSN